MTYKPQWWEPVFPRGKPINVTILPMDAEKKRQMNWVCGALAVSSVGVLLITLLQKVL